MATLTQIKNKANKRLGEFWKTLVDKQASYHAQHGKYFQLLVTNRVVDGEDTPFEVKHPSDEKNAQHVDLTFNSPIPFQIKVDEWVKGEETGYSATVVVELPNGDQYTRTRNNLNEDTNWQLINTEI